MKRRGLLSTIAIVGVAGCTSGNNTTPESTEPVGTSSGSGTSNTQTPTQNQTPTDLPSESPELVWDAIAGARRGNGHHYPVPVVMEDTLVVPSGLNEAGLVEGFNLENGDKEWEVSFDDSMISDQPNLPTDGSVLVIGTHNGIQAISGSGDVEWSEDIRPAGDLLGANNTIYIPKHNGIEARAFDGSQKWVWDCESQVYDIGFANGSVYGKSGTSLYSISDGETEWEYQTTLEPSVPPVANDTMVFIGTENSTLVSINIENQSVEWEQEVGNSIAAPITIGNYIYAAGWSYPLKAYDPTNGEVAWEFDPTYQTISAAVQYNETVYVGDNDHLFARAAADGKPVWSYSVDSSIWAPPAVSGNRLFVTTENGGILCLSV